MSDFAWTILIKWQYIFYSYKSEQIFFTISYNISVGNIQSKNYHYKFRFSYLIKWTKIRKCTYILDKNAALLRMNVLTHTLKLHAPKGIQLINNSASACRDN